MDGSVRGASRETGAYSTIILWSSSMPSGRRVFVVDIGRFYHFARKKSIENR